MPLPLLSVPDVLGRGSGCCWKAGERSPGAAGEATGDTPRRWLPGSALPARAQPQVASPAWRLGRRHRRNKPPFLFPVLPEPFLSHIPGCPASSPGLSAPAAQPRVSAVSFGAMPPNPPQRGPSGWRRGGETSAWGRGARGLAWLAGCSALLRSAEPGSPRASLSCSQGAAGAGRFSRATFCPVAPCPRRSVPPGTPRLPQAAASLQSS